VLFGKHGKLILYCSPFASIKYLVFVIITDANPLTESHKML